MDDTVLRTLLQTCSETQLEAVTETKHGDEVKMCPEESQNCKEQHIFICSECSILHSSVEECREHMLQHHAGLCFDNSNANDSAKVEMNKISDKITKQANGSDSIKSSQILQDIPSEDSNTDKRKKPAQIKKFRCTEDSCSFRFNLEEHQKYHLMCHLPRDKSFICPECSGHFPRWRDTKFHLWKAHKIDIDLHKCDTCNYRTYSMFKLRNHKLIHSDERRFSCVNCGKTFKQRNQLRNHQIIHKDKKDIPEKHWCTEQECNICFRKFSDSKCLKKHIAEVHNKIKPHNCKYCDYTTSRKGMLQLHMRNHTGEKPYKCEFCDYRSADHNSLRRHRMRHTGERRYTCPHCKYSSIQAISLKSHMISKHPGKEGAYSCARCQFTSINKDIFESHVSDHNQGLIPGTSNVPAEKDASVLSSQFTETLKTDTEQSSMNLKTAETVSKCLHALTETDGVAQLPPGVKIIASQIEDGVQTVTLEIPGENDTSCQHFLLKIQPSSNEALHIMYQPMTDVLSSNDNDLSAIKLTEECVPPLATLKLPEISTSHAPPMPNIINPDQVFLQEYKNIDQGVLTDTFLYKFQTL